MKEVSIVNKLATRKEIDEMFKEKCLPLVIGISEEEALLDDMMMTSLGKFGNLYIKWGPMGEYETTYLLVAYQMDKKEINPTKLVINESKLYPIIGVFNGDIDNLYTNPGGFTCQKKDKEKYYSILSLSSKIKRKIEGKKPIGGKPNVKSKAKSK